MSNALRTLAVAAVMAGLAPMAAQAAVVRTSLDMSFLPPPAGTWTAGPISAFGNGVTISNAALFSLSSGRLALANSGTDPITISIDKDLFHLNALSLEYFSEFAVDISINGSSGQSLTRTGGQWVSSSLQRICPSTEPKCNAKLLLDGTDNWITSIEFTPDTSNGQDFVGLNGLNFTQIDTTGGNNGGGGTVPEPAGYGLTALALLAAGVASRRRNAR